MQQITGQERQAAVEAASGAFGNGFHCAEAVVSSVLKAMGADASEATAHATAFGGGIGETFAGACGALSGALIAIGHLHGRREPGGDWDLPAELGAEIHQRFLREHQTAHCAALRDRFGEERQMTECRKLVETTTDRLLALLADHAQTTQGLYRNDAPGPAPARASEAN